MLFFRVKRGLPHGSIPGKEKPQQGKARALKSLDVKNCLSAQSMRAYQICSGVKQSNTSELFLFAICSRAFPISEGLGCFSTSNFAALARCMFFLLPTIAERQQY